MEFKHLGPSFALASSRVLGAVPASLYLQQASYLCILKEGAESEPSGPQKLALPLHSVNQRIPASPARCCGPLVACPAQYPSLQLPAIPPHTTGSYSVGEMRVSFLSTWVWSEATQHCEIVALRL